MVLRGPGGREGAGLSHAPVAPPEPGRSLPRPAQRADRRVRAGGRPDPPDRGRRFHARADGERDRGLPAGERGRADRRLPALPRAGQRHRRAVRQPPRDRGRHAGLRRPVDRDRRPVLRRLRRPVRATSGCSTGCGWCPRSKSRTGVSLEIGPGPSAGPAGTAAGREDPGAIAARERSTKSNPRRLGRMPSGCCDRS